MSHLFYFAERRYRNLSLLHLFSHRHFGSMTSRSIFFRFFLPWHSFHCFRTDYFHIYIFDLFDIIWFSWVLSRHWYHPHLFVVTIRRRFLCITFGSFHYLNEIYSQEFNILPTHSFSWQSKLTAHANTPNVYAAIYVRKNISIKYSTKYRQNTQRDGIWELQQINNNRTVDVEWSYRFLK